MNIGVLGLQHLGSVTAAALASLGHRVIGLDFDARTVSGLAAGRASVVEPSLDGLLMDGLASGNLRFSSIIDDVKAVDVLWVAYDTPVDEDDEADAEFVLTQVERALAALGADVVVLVSSQLPAGSIRRLEQATALSRAPGQLHIACSPENLRLGSAVNDFLHPQRIVVGVRSPRDKDLLAPLFASLTDTVEWMSIESAEMTKHAINGFFAASIAFANELASLCEVVGADAKEVERGLKSEMRIGPRAYLAPGAAFAGGTLARDVTYLNHLATMHGVATPFLSSVMSSNDAHKQWVRRQLREMFTDLSAITVSIWGLTYKAGTDSLRRSPSVELGDWLMSEGATLQVHDPLIKHLPAHWCDAVSRFDDPLGSARGAQAVVVATPVPIYRTITAGALREVADGLVILDPNRFLPHLATDGAGLHYMAVGMPSRSR